MTRKRLVPVVAAVVGAAGLAAAGCAHSNGGATTSAVRIATSEQEVAGCERVIRVRVTGAESRKDAQVELEKLTSDRGGNVLLLPASGDGTSGTAYKCSGEPATASN